MVDYNAIINEYYTAGSELHSLLVEHSRQVADLALALGRDLQRRGTDVALAFVEEAAMLHDIGIFLTDAPGIHCHGTEPYIRHGLLGAELLRGKGLERHARVCERHTGAGITIDDIMSQHLPLPERDFTPETVEEKLVCYADKFFSKSHPERRKTLEQARRSLLKFGHATVDRFDALHRLLATTKQ